MRLYTGGFPFIRRSERQPERKGKSLRLKLMIAILPAVVIILAVAGYASYLVSCQYIDIALDRNVRVQTRAVAHDISSTLERCRQDLLFIAQGKTTPEDLRDFLARKSSVGGLAYRELGYLSPDEGGHVLYVLDGTEIHRVDQDRMGQVQPNPFLMLEDSANLPRGDVSLSQVLTAEYPFPSPENANRKISSHILRLATPCDPDGDGRMGLMFLGLDVKRLRDILSLYNSPKSPLWAYPRSDEIRFSYAFDQQGWILFQSEDPDARTRDLGTYLARAGLDGTLGRPGLDCAFRPVSTNGNFWSMVAGTRAGKADLFHLSDGGAHSSEVKDYYLSYAPIFFRPSPNKAPEVFWGVAFVDRSKLTLAAGYKHLDALFVVTLAAIGLLGALIFLAGRLVTRPIIRLSEMVRDFRLVGGIKKIDLQSAGYETGLLTETINDMIGIIQQQSREIQAAEQALRKYTLRERADIEQTDPDQLDADFIPEIVGRGPRIARLKEDILKAAQADIDVLIVGETGTGKQLAAEAIRAHSPRAAKPFIAINCGALDENLLLDTLFGHVKGAFTDSKTDRKGAFLEANGGTLFLDEIQSASPRVQQSLLRALAERRIKPLGSDQEISIDVRVIAATNADLTALIREGSFREDLYFRLKVISVQTPPLREHRESLPVLVRHYLATAQQMLSKSGMGLSRGAMEKLCAYHWPGNIRELVNAITRAVVMAEGDLIQASDLRLEQEPSFEADSRPEDGGVACAADGEWERLAPREARSAEQPGSNGDGPGHREPEPAAQAHRAPAEPAPPAPPAQAKGSAPASGPTPGLPPDGQLSDRQRTALPVILERGEVTRQEYQDIVGDGMSSRTAVYDLQDLVQKGLLTKVGRGPATKYVVAG